MPAYIERVLLKKDLKLFYHLYKIMYDLAGTSTPSHCQLVGEKGKSLYPFTYDLKYSYLLCWVSICLESAGTRLTFLAEEGTVCVDKATLN